MENVSWVHALPQKRTVTVDGQEYKVKKDFLTGEEKVEINDKVYVVKKGSNPIACDLPADVVRIKGREYVVRDPDDLCGRLGDKIGQTVEKKATDAVKHVFDKEV